MNNENNAPTSSIVDAIFDAALAWADHGLTLGKTALEGTATALAKTAKSVEAIREKLASDPHAA